MKHLTKHVSLEAFNGKKDELARPHVALIDEAKKILAYSNHGDFHAHEQGKAPILGGGSQADIPAPIAMFWDPETWELIKTEPLTAPLSVNGEYIVELFFDPAYSNSLNLTWNDGEGDRSFNGNISDFGRMYMMQEGDEGDNGEYADYIGKLELWLEFESCSVNGFSVEPYPSRGSVNANGHDYVDLGLPSGRLWATRNIGADSPSAYGLYFPWASTVGYADASEHTFDYTAGNTPYIEGNEWDIDRINKYNNGAGGYDGNVDNIYALLPEDDAAHVNMGGDWRMPSTGDFAELFAFTTSEWTEQNGVNGRLFTSKQNGNSVFIPAAGYGSGSSVSGQGSIGDYWSRSLGAGDASSARSLYFGSGGVYPADYYDRYDGFSVRGVL